MQLITPAASLIFALALPAFSNAYTWNFKSTPQQCSDLTVEISGSGGSPPYRILIVPFGGTPFSNGSEVRTIFETPFDGDSTSVTFKLDYPADSQFVAVVSDAAGFGTGGTSVAAQVTSSDAAVCFDASQKNEPDFYYSIDPANQIVQCQDTRIYWTKGDPQGNPVFLGVIPGGQSFVIPQTDYTDVPSFGTGFSWKANLRSMATFLLVGGDGRGNGTAGSTLYTVGGGSQNDASCLGDDSPSSTAGDPAGGAYQTGSDGSGTDGGNGGNSGGDNGGSGGGGTSSSGPNIGAIVGGVVGGVGGVAAILLLLWFLRRKSKNDKKQKEKPIDLLNEEDEGDERPARQELPQYYEPEPFLVPDPTVDGSSTTGDHRAYMSSRSDTPDLMTPSTTSVGGGKRAPRQLRPVNIIQHDDAGPSDMGAGQEETETIELPPAYTKIRGDGSPGTPVPGTPEPRDREVV